MRPQPLLQSLQLLDAFSECGDLGQVALYGFRLARLERLDLSSEGSVLCCGVAQEVFLVLLLLGGQCHETLVL